MIRADDIEFLNAGAALAPAEPTRLPTLRDAERMHIQRALEARGWNKKEAAQMLDISRGTLYRKIEEYGLVPANASK